MSILLFYNLLFAIFASSTLGFYLGRLNVYIIVISCLVISLLLSLLGINEIILSLNILNVFLFEWLKLIIYVIDFMFYYDSLTTIMLFTVVGISTLVHIYSVGYLEYDPYLIRFLFFLAFFTFSMLLLVTASNFLQMFLGWEAVGLCSYLLINFWYTRVLANKAALKAMIMNRISDVIFILGVVLLLLLFYNTDYSLVFDLINPYLDLGYNKIVFFYLSLNIIDLICFFLFMGSVGKSAQLGLHTWLPDAMEGWVWALLKFHCMREHLKTIWSTQELILLGKIQIVRQSAGNKILFFKNSEVGSSETIRGTFDYKDFYLLNLDSKFKFWFIGFTEGVGSFIVNKNGYLEFKITQSSIDAQILFYIKKILGFGSVSIQDKKNKTHHYRVRNKKGFLTLINIFNGNLLTEKKNIQFKEWLNAFNILYGAKILLIEKKKKPNLDNSWLSGFTDAEGCFTSSVIIRSESYNQVHVKYILSQKHEFDLLTKIAILFCGKLSYLKSYDGYNMTVNLSKLSKVINYFSLFPLKTKKYISYLYWIKVYKLVKHKKYMDSNGLIEIKNLINKINK